MQDKYLPKNSLNVIIWEDVKCLGGLWLSLRASGAALVSSKSFLKNSIPFQLLRGLGLSQTDLEGSFKDYIIVDYVLGVLLSKIYSLDESSLNALSQQANETITSPWSHDKALDRYLDKSREIRTELFFKRFVFFTVPFVSSTVVYNLVLHGLLYEEKTRLVVDVDKQGKPDDLRAEQVVSKNIFDGRGGYVTSVFVAIISSAAIGGILGLVIGKFTESGSKNSALFGFGALFGTTGASFCAVRQSLYTTPRQLVNH